MHGEVDRFTSRTPTRPNHPALDRRTERSLVDIARRTMIRQAGVRAQAIVQTEKVREIDYVTREAMTGHALLSKWRDQLAGDDILLADDLRFLLDAARLAKGEMIADLMTTYCEEGRS